MTSAGNPGSAASLNTVFGHNPRICRTDVSPLPGQAQFSPRHDKEDTDDWEHNPINPHNWSQLRKWTTTALVSFYTFVTPLATAMMAPGLPDVALKFDITNSTVLALTLSIFLLSFGIGPLFLSPLSEIYGRVWVLHISNLVFLCFNLGCALARTANALIAFRFLSGFAGSVPVAISCAAVGDLFTEKDRAFAMAVYNFGPLIGPAIGPVMGGFISQTIGVQYVFYVIAGLSGVAAVLAIPFLRETYAPVIQRRIQMHSKNLEQPRGAIPLLEGQDQPEYLWISLKRPIVLLSQSFICFILSLYSAFVASIYYLMFATFPVLYTEVYHFSVAISGLAYLGLGIGFITATLFGARISGRMYLQLAAKSGGQAKPEMRIPPLIFGATLTPIGILWYGWSAQDRLHWIMPIIGTAIYAFSLMCSVLAINLYIVDSFTYSASALAAVSMFRYLLAFGFPLFGEQMFAKLDYGGGNTLLAGIAIVIGIPFPVWIYYYGERIRMQSPIHIYHK